MFKQTHEWHDKKNGVSLQFSFLSHRKTGSCLVSFVMYISPLKTHRDSSFSSIYQVIHKKTIHEVRFPLEIEACTNKITIGKGMLSAN